MLQQLSQMTYIYIVIKLTLPLDLLCKEISRYKSESRYKHGSLHMRMEKLLTRATSLALGESKP